MAQYLLEAGLLTAAALIIALALVAAGILAWTANLGGKIRHPEIRDGDGSIPPVAAP